MTAYGHISGRPFFKGETVTRPEAAAQLETRLEKRYREPVLWARIDGLLAHKRRLQVVS